MICGDVNNTNVHSQVEILIIVDKQQHVWYEKHDNQRNRDLLRN